MVASKGLQESDEQEEEMMNIMKKGYKTMKKVKCLLMLAVIAATSFSLVSCDDDHYWNDGPGWDRPSRRDDPQQPTEDPLVLEAQTLVGEWYGPVKYTYLEEGGKTYGEDNFYADMVFYQSTNSGQNGSQNVNKSLMGGGIEIDYKFDDKGNVVDQQTLPFNWNIDKNGDIYIQYQNSAATFVLDASASQHGFSLGRYDGYKNDIFKGWMIGINNNEGDLIQFDFQRVETSTGKARKSGSSSVAASESVSGTFGKGELFQMPKISIQSLNHRR